MSSRVAVFLPVAGSLDRLRDRFVGDPGSWFDDARPSGLDRWTVPLRYRGISRLVQVQVGAVWSTPSTLWRTVTWQPTPSEGDVGPVDRLLPSLTAELALHRKDGSASLVLSGVYDPPGAKLGELADAVLLRRVAERTALTFVEDVARGLAAAPAPA